VTVIILQSNLHFCLCRATSKTLCIVTGTPVFHTQNLSIEKESCNFMIYSTQQIIMNCREFGYDEIPVSEVGFNKHIKKYYPRLLLK